MENTQRRKGRPPIPHDKKRQRINLTLSSEVISLAEDAIKVRDENSISELVEAALRKIIAESEDEDRPNS